MTFQTKIATNRNNDRKRRGPRTAAGKSRVSVNALRHGLAAVTRYNPAHSPQIERMARAICGDDQNPLLFDQALVIAEHEIVLLRVRAERVAAIERRRDKLNSTECRDEFDAMRHALPDLDRLARYERRAWSRRKRAIRNFMKMKSKSNDSQS
jgi:hypothetical protein